MTVVHAAVQAVATATPVATPVPTPSPVAQAATHAATQVTAHSGVLDTLNALAASVTQQEVIAISTAIVVVLQGLLNKYLPWLQHEVDAIENFRRRFVAVVLPLAATYVASFTSGHNDLKLAPAVFLAGQVIVWTAKGLKAAWDAAVAAQSAKAAVAAADTTAVGQG